MVDGSCHTEELLPVNMSRVPAGGSPSSLYPLRFRASVLYVILREGRAGVHGAATCPFFPREPPSLSTVPVQSLV